MKTIFKSTILLLITLAVFGCKKSYDAPPIDEPEYGGKANITIAELKALYADITDPTEIDVAYILEANVVGNDISGNIYKQLYVQDDTGAINIGIEENSIYATHRVGQRIFLELHGLAMVKYGGELQIGYPDVNANRIPWEIYTDHVHFDGFPNEKNAVPTLMNIPSLKAGDVNKLIRLDNIYFVNGGVNAFTTNDASTDEAIKDGAGNTINVRTSSYSTFANDLLPEGSGSIVGVLGRYNNTWQLIIRSTDDLINFGGALPTDPGPGTGEDEVIYYETFGTGTYPSGNRPKLEDFTDFDDKSVTWSVDPLETLDIRSISGNNSAHIWFPANRAAKATISGINTSGYTDIKLSFELAANVYNSSNETNLNNMQVSFNGKTFTIPSTPVSGANGDDGKFYTFEFSGLDAVTNGVLEFNHPGTSPQGMRLDNIKVYVDDAIIL